MTWEEIKTEVEASGNVRTYPMEVLRDALGVSKLGVNVRQRISEELDGIGISHIPAALPQFHWDQVRLYKRSSSVGRMIERILAPGGPNDAAIIEKFSDSGPDYAQMIQQIREIVSE